MDRELAILIVEDDQQACQELSGYIEALDGARLVGSTTTAAEAVTLVSDTMPDVLILDLELHRGGGNGLMVLEQLRQQQLTKVPYVLVTTNNSSAVTYEAVRQLGADFIMAKHQEGYSAKHVVDFLMLLKDTIMSHHHVEKIPAGAPESPAQRQKRTALRIAAELNNIGISPKAVGYAYLADAIGLLISKNMVNITTVISKTYKKTESSVERAMQNAINKAWRTNDIEDLLRYYTAKINSDRGVPTLTEFIYYYANKLKMEL